MISKNGMEEKMATAVLTTTKTPALKQQQQKQHRS